MSFTDETLEVSIENLASFEDGVFWDEWRHAIRHFGYEKIRWRFVRNTHENQRELISGERKADRKPAAFHLYYSLNLTESHRKDFETWKQEILLVSRVPHLNLIDHFEHFIINNALTVITDYTEPKNLEQDLIFGDNHSYSERQARIYFRQIIAAINHLHRLGIAHRNLCLSKAHRFDYTGEQIIKISSYSLSRMARPNDRVYKSIYNYSPERLLSYIEKTFMANSIEYNSFGDDVWALGVCLFEMLTGMWPFMYNSVDERDLRRLLTSEAKRQWSMTGEHRVAMSDDCFYLLESMLEPNPGLRLNCEQIVRHNWLKIKL